MREDNKKPEGEYISTSTRRFYGALSLITGVALIFSTLICYSRGSQLETQGKQIENLKAQVLFQRTIHSLDSTTIKSLEDISSRANKLYQQRDSLERSFRLKLRPRPGINQEEYPVQPGHNI